MSKAMGVVLVSFLAAGVVLALGDKVKKASSKPITGQCHCGHVKYEVKGAVVECNFCDCRGCQRATGTLKSPFVVVKRSAFAVTAGKPSEFRSQSKAKCDWNGTWHFCPKCGTQVYWEGHKGNKTDIFAGTLDDTTIFQCKE
ncbi:GFA family protein [Planctomycetota bacterium]